MNLTTKRITALMEFLINGSFIIFYTLYKANLNIFKLQSVTIESIFSICIWVVPFITFLVLISHFLSLDSVEDFLRKQVFTLIIFIPMLITFGDIEFVYWLSAVHLFSTIISSLEKDDKERLGQIKPKLKTLSGFFTAFNISAAQWVLLTWTGTILIGALLLMLPVSAVPENPVGFVDALFVSASAVSTTGLTTISLQDQFSYFGNIIILILFQIGGVGFMAMSSALMMITGRNFAIKEKVVIQDVMDVTDMNELFGMVMDIVRYTFAIEFIGTGLLTYGFIQEGFEIGEALWLGFFHSISAFCTAGFSLFNTNMEAFTTNSIISWTCSLLAILGGLGFMVMKESLKVLQGKMKFVMISMHSKVILATSFLMYTIGTLVIFFGEFLHSLDSYSLYDKFHIAFFQFTAAMSTSGFNTVPINSMHSYSLFFIMLSMFIGCSPGSTGGGIKITTFAILIQSVRTTLTGKDEVEFFERSLPSSVVVKATALTIISLTIVAFSIFLMMFIEPKIGFQELSYEVMSAFGTVGLSMGITSSLSILGKICITAVMFVGRIGPLTLVLALAEKRERKGKVIYPKGKMMIG